MLCRQECLDLGVWSSGYWCVVQCEEVSWANISVDDLAAQAMLFFGAGFETTASLLSFALYELSKPGNGKEIQGRVREEVDRVMKEDGGKITYEGLKRMQLLDRVLNG
ncbi:hypothetical protein J437_LFUL009389 [Ladona fulva]|uniref:Cytochrome P450 n=1 Tax=Ladona fulva TaxID=123851 RepID=A0A8K0P123_LADFU|nr:hypothetical protein J437_LFUL009389 [Ladona fulva]